MTSIILLDLYYSIKFNRRVITSDKTHKITKVMSIDKQTLANINKTKYYQKKLP